MILKNCDLRTFRQHINNKHIILFGVGQAFRAWITKVLVDTNIDKKIKYIVDNGADGTREVVGNRSIPVYHPNKLKNEKNVYVVITNKNYMFEMYQQLEDMELDDTISVFVMHYIMAVSNGEKIPALEKILCNNDILQKKIEKRINTFWFSDEPIPDGYRRCIDSWQKYCPEYEIRIWNSNNYDCEQNAFLRKALSCKKWAFVSDYARVDVLYQNGGIYMDMDVEVIKNLDSLLGNKAFFSFDMFNDIGLEIFGTQKGNILLYKIRDLYKSIEFDPARIEEFVQPRLIRNVVREFGVRLDGDMQCVDGMIFAPRSYFNPRDPIIYEYAAMDQKTFTIHSSSVSWKDHAMEIASRKKVKKLWDILYN